MDHIEWLGVSRQALEASIGAEFDAAFGDAPTEYWLRMRTSLQQWKSEMVPGMADRIAQLPEVLREHYRRWFETRLFDRELAVDGFTIDRLCRIISDNADTKSGDRPPQEISAAFLAMANIVTHPGELRRTLRGTKYLRMGNW